MDTSVIKSYFSFLSSVPGVSNGHLLFRGGKVIELSTRVSHALGTLLLGEDTNTAADSLGGVLVITSDHDDSDTGLLAGGDGGLDLNSGGIQHTNNTNEGKVDLKKTYHVLQTGKNYVLVHYCEQEYNKHFKKTTNETFYDLYCHNIYVI